MRFFIRLETSALPAAKQRWYILTSWMNDMPINLSLIHIYADLALRWGMSKATVCRYLKKLSDLGYLSLVSFPGTHGTAIYLQNYLSTMFQISDVMLDKDEIALALHIKVELDSVSQTDSGVSESNMETVLKKVGQILTAQGFPCLSCSKSHCKLLPLSDDCQRAVLGGIAVSYTHLGTPFFSFDKIISPLSSCL